jgi:hypothetical protein
MNTLLTSLYCNNNSLTELNVSENTLLTNLQCQYNQLSALDVSDNTALTNLRVQSNQFTNTALDALFNTLRTGGSGKTIYIWNNPGTAACNQSIATGRGWTVDTTAYN